MDTFIAISKVVGNDWAILFAVIILLLLIRLFGLLISILRYWYWEARGEFGPILVEEISDKPGMSVLMRQYLAECGAKCSNADEPNASPGFDKISAALAATELPQVKIIVIILSIIEFLFPIRAKKPGYTVSCILTGDESKPSVLTGDDSKPSVNIYIEIKLTDKGKIKRSEIFGWGFK